MANVCQGSFSVGTAGTTTVNMPTSFTPIFIEFEIGPRSGVTESLVTRSSGWQDIGNNRKAAMSIFDDGTLRRTVETTANSITHYKNVSGTFTQIIAGGVSAVGLGTFDYTSTLVDVAYTIRYKAFGV